MTIEKGATRTPWYLKEGNQASDGFSSSGKQYNGSTCYRRRNNWKGIGNMRNPSFTVTQARSNAVEGWLLPQNLMKQKGYYLRENEKDSVFELIWLSLQRHGDINNSLFIMWKIHAFKTWKHIVSKKCLSKLIHKQISNIATMISD